MCPGSHQKLIYKNPKVPLLLADSYSKGYSHPALIERFSAWKSYRNRVGLFTLGVFIMSMVIGTNISSLTAQRHLASSKNDMEDAMERLASGSRINSSRDDAAGLAIAGRMTSQISGLNQSVRNANDGIALAQSAEGALDETTSILQRMRDLSVQASSDTLTSVDRTSIQQEITALTSEIDRISSTTTFNNKNLLDGTATALQFQVGISAGENVSLSVKGASATDLGLMAGSTTGSVASLNGARMTTLQAVYSDSIQINGEDWATDIAPSTVVGATLGVTNSSGISVTAKTSTADGVKAIINEGTSRHGAVATASNVVKSTGLFTSTQAINTNADITINGSAVQASSNIVSFAANINDLGLTTKARLVDNNTYIELYNTTGENIVVAGTVAGSGLAAATQIGFLQLSNADGTATTIERGKDSTVKTTILTTRAMGFNEHVGKSSIEGRAVANTKLLATVDDFTINDISISPSTTAMTSASAATLAAHLNTFTTQTGVTATAQNTVTLNMETTNVANSIKSTNASTDKMTVNGVVIAFTTATDTMANFVTAMNTALATSGIVASVSGSAITLTSDTGDRISVTDTNSSVGNFEHADGTIQAAATALVAYEGHLTLTNQSGGDVRLGTVNGTAAELTSTLAKLGLVSQGDGTTTSTTSAGLSMSTSASAANSITAIDAALEKVFAARGHLGAFQNRLDHTVANLRNVSENTAFSKSQIQDTDFATESANLAKAQVLQQAGTAMLAQANASGQSVLSLLK
jgi:flagellin